MVGAPEIRHRLRAQPDQVVIGEELIILSRLATSATDEAIVAGVKNTHEAVLHGDVRNRRRSTLHEGTVFGSVGGLFDVFLLARLDIVDGLRLVRVERLEVQKLAREVGHPVKRYQVGHTWSSLASEARLAGAQAAISLRAGSCLSHSQVKKSFARLDCERVGVTLEGLGGEKDRVLDLEQRTEL